MSLQGKRILLGVTGGIAAYKACELLRLLVKAGADVEVMMTKAAAQFVGPLTFETLSGKPQRISGILKCGFRIFLFARIKISSS